MDTPLEAETRPEIRAGSEVGGPETVTLRDGTAVTIRPIRPDDAPRLQALFDRLSPESIFLRFLAYQKNLPDRQAYDLAHVDYHRRMALVATHVQGGEEQIIAVARYAVIREDWPELAEAALAVEDRYQGRGLGTLLFERMIAYALKHGIRAFCASIHFSNTRMLGLMKRTGLPIKKRSMDLGVWEIQMALQPETTAG